jgi:hypothetical protein
MRRPLVNVRFGVTTETRVLPSWLRLATIPSMDMSSSTPERHDHDTIYPVSHGAAAKGCIHSNSSTSVRVPNIEGCWHGPAHSSMSRPHREDAHALPLVIDRIIMYITYIYVHHTTCVYHTTRYYIVESINLCSVPFLKNDITHYTSISSFQNALSWLAKRLR